MINNNFLKYNYKIYFISYYLLYFLKIITLDISKRIQESYLYFFKKICNITKDLG